MMASSLPVTAILADAAVVGMQGVGASAAYT